MQNVWVWAHHLSNPKTDRLPGKVSQIQTNMEVSKMETSILNHLPVRWVILSTTDIGEAW